MIRRSMYYIPLVGKRNRNAIKKATLYLIPFKSYDYFSDQPIRRLESLHDHNFPKW